MCPTWEDPPSWHDTPFPSFSTFHPFQVTPAAWCDAQILSRNLVVRCSISKPKLEKCLTQISGDRKWNEGRTRTFVGLDILHRLAMKMASSGMQICMSSWCRSGCIRGQADYSSEHFGRDISYLFLTFPS